MFPNVAFERLLNLVINSFFTYRNRVLGNTAVAVVDVCACEFNERGYSFLNERGAGLIGVSNG